MCYQLYLTVYLVILISQTRICTSRAHNSKPVADRNYETLATEMRDDNETLHMNLGYFHVVEGISVGLDEAVRECRHQFQWDRWNCPVQSPSLLNKASTFKATKEAAYLQAISAAGVMYHVTKKCDHPNNDICGCESRLYKRMTKNKEFRTEKGGDWRSHWRWRGCQQNIWFGEKVARIFLGIDADGGSALDEMRKHNELAGIKAVKRSRRVTCKCHGATGSCTLKTCWKVLPEFRKIAKQLKRKYRKSKNTQYQNVKLRSSNKVTHPGFNKIKNHDLVYSETSPDYCYPDNTIGHLGTLGRECKVIEWDSNKTSTSSSSSSSSSSLSGKSERSSCRRLCRYCGYRVGRRASTQTYECECKFKWCCRVECKHCERRVWHYYCKDEPRELGP